MAELRHLTVQQGKTFTMPVGWENGDLVVRKPITAISLAFGAPRLSFATAHGLPSGWRTYVTRCQGMKLINADDLPPRDSDYHRATVIDATTIELNDIDPVDDNGREWPAYTTGGFLNWNAPVDLTGYTARMSICDREVRGLEKIANLWQPTTAYVAGQYVVLADGSTVLLCKTAGTSGATRPTAGGTDGTVVWMIDATFSGPKELYRLSSPSAGIVIDNTAKTITLSIPATTTDDFTWTKGVYDLEMVSATGTVAAILSGKVIVTREVTT